MLGQHRRDLDCDDDDDGDDDDDDDSERILPRRSSNNLVVGQSRLFSFTGFLLTISPSATPRRRRDEEVEFDLAKEDEHHL